MPNLIVNLTTASAAWELAHSTFEEKLRAVDKRSRTTSEDEFAAHLLDVHRMWCEACQQLSGRGGGRAGSGSDRTAATHPLKTAPTQRGVHGYPADAGENVVTVGRDGNVGKKISLHLAIKKPTLQSGGATPSAKETQEACEDIFQEESDEDSQSESGESDGDNGDDGAWLPEGQDDDTDEEEEDSGKKTEKATPVKSSEDDELSKFTTHSWKDVNAGPSLSALHCGTSKEESSPAICFAVTKSSSKKGKVPWSNHYQSICEICNRACSSKDDYENHLLTHTSQRSYPCSECRDSFSTEKFLSMHILEAHRKLYRCVPCDRSFTKNARLRDHNYRVHSVKKDLQFQCSLCDKSFARSSNLRTHTARMHSEEKFFPCSICNKSFGVQGHLKTHMKTHTTEKPYQCSKCNEGFSQNEDLQVHIISKHTEENPKPYQCYVCGMRFDVKARLKRHTCVNDDTQQNYRCFICQQVFLTRKELALHINSHNM